MNFYNLKQLAANVLTKVLPLEFSLRVSRNRYILAYHRIVPSALATKFNMQNSMWVSPETFNEDILWMKNRGDIVDLETILDYRTPTKRPLFSITFDDGWIDNYSHAFPIIKKHNIPATIFLVTDAIETGHLFWVEDLLYKIAQLSSEASSSKINGVLSDYFKKAAGSRPDGTNTTLLAERLAELIKPYSKEDRTTFLTGLYNDLGIDPAPMSDQILSWSNITEMDKYGIEFGSHTHTHEILQYADNEKIEQELEISRDIIRKKTGKPVRYFCYPNARYRDSNAKFIEQAGYEYAFRIHNLRIRENQNRYFIPRYLLNERTNQNKNYLLCKLLGFPKF